MRGIVAILLLTLTTSGCAMLGANPRLDESTRLWNRAHTAFTLGAFDEAESLFRRLSQEYAELPIGREALFYLGTLRLDPRNPQWDPQPAEARLTEYVALDSEAGLVITRRPEAETLLRLARQLNMPADERVPGLQPETRVVRERVVVPARESLANAAEAERLRRQLSESEATVQQLRDELERIRKTLTGTPQGP